MKQWLYNLRYQFSRWMIGRYGYDELSRGMMAIVIILMLLSLIPHLGFISILGWILIILVYYRCFSKNVVKRTAERTKYLQLTYKIRTRLNTYKRMWNERKTYRYFKCPTCKSYVRVPKGKGKIAIRCTKCSTEMIRKS